MTEEFLAGFYGLMHTACGGEIKPTRIGINENDQLVVLGNCRKCGDQRVATLIRLSDLKILAGQLRRKKVVPIASSPAFTIKDASELHQMGISLPTGEEGR